ncbi:unnamed protein product, partial [Closterium sp. NIES-53]
SATAPRATADSATRSQWLNPDAAARLAIRNHLPLAECAHFGQHRTEQALYDTVVARYSSPATAALGRLLLPYVFPELSAFATVEDLISHLHTSDARFRATVPAEFLDRNQPPMFITLYFIVTRLPDSLRSVRDHFLSLDPTSLSVDLLEQHLLAAETSAVATSLLLRMSGLLLLVRSAAAARARVAGVVEVAAVVVKVVAGVVVGAAVEVVEAVEVVAAVGLVAGVGPLEAAVEAAVGVAAVEAVGLVAVGLDLGVEALVVANGRSSTDRVRPSHSSSSRPRWADLLSSGVAIFDLDYDVILSAMYALSASAEGDCYRCVPPDPGIAAAALGASESACVDLHVYTDGPSPGHVHSLARTLLWHHRLGHPSLPRLRGMLSRLLVSGLARSMPPLPPSPAPPCLPCVEERQRVAPQSSFPPTTAPPQTLHMDVWGPARISGQGRERYFLLVVDDYTQYTTVFPLLSKGEVIYDLPVLRLHSDRGGDFSSDLLRDFCRGEGILHSFMLPDSPRQNGIAERHIGLVREVARTSMIHAAAPRFLWLVTLESALPGTAPAEALHTFTLDSGASRCFFGDSTTFTPLYAPVPVRLAYPSGGSVLACSSTVLPCPAIPSGSLKGLHLPSFSTNLTLLWHHHLRHPSVPRLRGLHSLILVSGLPRSLPPFPPSPAPPCLSCVEGRQRATPHSSFPPTNAPLQTLHMDVKGEVPDVLIPWILAFCLQLRERFRQDLPVLRLHVPRFPSSVVPGVGTTRSPSCTTLCTSAVVGPL